MKKTIAKDIVIDGFVIVSPKSDFWDQDEVIKHFEYKSFGTTEVGAWRRHIGPNHPAHELSTIIQRWHDKGYRVREAQMIIKK